MRMRADALPRREYVVDQFESLDGGVIPKPRAFTRGARNLTPTGHVTSVAVADCHRIRLQTLQQRAVLRQKFEVPALGAFQHYVAALRAIGEKRQLGERSEERRVGKECRS